MKLRMLLEKVGLAKRDASDPVTELDRQVAALRISVESIAKAELASEEREVLLDETLGQFRKAYLTKASGDLTEEDEEFPVEDEKEEAEEEAEEEASSFPVTGASSTVSVSSRPRSGRQSRESNARRARRSCERRSQTYA